MRQGVSLHLHLTMIQQDHDRRRCGIFTIYVRHAWLIGVHLALVDELRN